ncbi:MAG: hypothetical protein O7E57_15860 [Gammaproteobacteria bacterium]|nr:hypothetical protein [Gammaproteobacteria bacterium]
MIVEERFVAVTVISSRMLSCALATPDKQKKVTASDAATAPMWRPDASKKCVVKLSLPIAPSPQVGKIHIELTGTIVLCSL